jgi:hypothetical protein
MRPYRIPIKRVVRAAARGILGPTGYRLCKAQYVWICDLRRSGKPREHFESFAKNPAPREEGGSDIERAFYSHEGRLIDKWGHYFEIYERFLSPFRAKEALRLLEIGVSHGGSLQLWRKYFGPAARIAGLDIDPRTEFCEGNTRVFVGSQDDPAALDRALDWLGGVDVVIDDGSHIVRHQMATLDYLFPRLSDGESIYVKICTRITGLRL